MSLIVTKRWTFIALIYTSSYLYATEISPPLRNSHAYIGGQLGWAHAHNACNADNTRCDNEEIGWGLYGGYQLTDWFGLELGYKNFGHPNSSYIGGEVKSDIETIDISSLFRYHLSDRWNTYARLGAAYENVDKRYGPTGSEISLSHSGWGLLTGLGVEYALASTWSVRGEISRNSHIGGDETYQADHYFTALGISYHFGQDAVNTPAATTPEVIPTQTTISLNAQALFAYNSAQLIPNSELTALAKQLTQNPHAITVIGHTDDRGSQRYNQSLSEQRAHAVADYLAEQGIAKEELSVQGFGELQPIASNTTEDGRAQNRRVEIHVSSQK
ncbi:MAG: OmpA family protein [Plesiomonas sp.]|uniref:OmpA family protein n=1 Tax=Plesiomonas sp. TaxID=2486279 RepID=UPI003F40597E